MSQPEIQALGIEVFKEALQRLEGITYRIGGGTAIGLYRDGDLIPTDTDIDFLIPGNQFGRGNIRDRFGGYDIGCNTDEQFVVVHPKKHIIVDFQFYYPVAKGYAVRTPHYFEFRQDQLDSPLMLPTPYGVLPIVGDPEDYFVRKYRDWRTPKYQAKRVLP